MAVLEETQGEASFPSKQSHQKAGCNAQVCVKWLQPRQNISLLSKQIQVISLLLGYGKAAACCGFFSGFTPLEQLWWSSDSVVPFSRLCF